MTDFTPLASLAGGLMIGLAAVAMMGLFGRIAGISGIFANLITHGWKGRHILDWRAGFVIGLVVSGSMIAWVAPGPLVVSHNPFVLIAGGLLVGFGSRLGSGCTSGHGVCGMSRLSARSIVATVTFMIVAIATVYFTTHIIGAGA